MDACVGYYLGGRVALHAIELDDAPWIVRWRNLDRAAFFNHDVVTPDTHREFLLHRRLHDLVWTARKQTTQSRVGMVSLTVNVKEVTAEFGRLFVAPEYRRQGFGEEISYTALAYAFEELRLNTLWLETHKDATAAQHLYEKIGWQQDGTIKERIRMAYTQSVWKEQQVRFVETCGVRLDSNHYT